MSTRQDLSFYFSRGGSKSYIIKLNHRCNYACIICGALDNNKKYTFRTLKEVKKEIYLAKNKGFKNIDFAGSEPTLHPDLFEMVSYTNKLRLHPVILTNGSMFASENYTKSFAKIKSLAIRISFYSHLQGIFDEMSQRPGSYNKVIKAIANIQRFLKVYPSHPFNFLSASITITAKNFKHLSKIVSFLFKLQVKVMQFSPVILAGNVYNHPELLVEPIKILPYLKKALVIAKRHKMHYYLCHIPVCLIESEYSHLVPKPQGLPGFFKFSFCVECPYQKTCCGITKGHLIARYGRQLLGSQRLFPQGFFDTFFSAQDLKLIHSLPV